VDESDLNIFEDKYNLMKGDIKKLQEQFINNKRKLTNANKIKNSLENYLNCWR
jgi:hypothetical protein